MQQHIQLHTAQSNTLQPLAHQLYKTHNSHHTFSNLATFKNVFDRFILSPYIFGLFWKSFVFFRLLIGEMLKSSKRMLLNILHTPLNTSRLLVTAATRDSFLLIVVALHCELDDLAWQATPPRQSSQCIVNIFVSRRPRKLAPPYTCSFEMGF